MALALVQIPVVHRIRLWEHHRRWLHFETDGPSFLQGKKGKIILRQSGDRAFEPTDAWVLVVYIFLQRPTTEPKVSLDETTTVPIPRDARGEVVVHLDAVAHEVLL